MTRLDTAICDGDHGTSIARAMDIAEKVVQDSEQTKAKGLLKNLGWGVMEVDGGATGPLLGSFLMGLSNGIEEQDVIDCNTLAAMFEAGLAGVSRQTKAQAGDKTMRDAAHAAENGAISTKNFKARFGRAKTLESASWDFKIRGQPPYFLCSRTSWRDFLKGSKDKYRDRQIVKWLNR